MLMSKAIFYCLKITQTASKLSLSIFSSCCQFLNVGALLEVHGVFIKK